MSRGPRGLLKFKHFPILVEKIPKFAFFRSQYSKRSGDNVNNSSMFGRDKKNKVPLGCSFRPWWFHCLPSAFGLRADNETTRAENCSPRAPYFPCLPSLLELLSYCFHIGGQRRHMFYTSSYWRNDTSYAHHTGCLKKCALLLRPLSTAD